MLEEGYSANSCRTLTLGLIQLFKYFDLDMKASVISSEAKKTVETEKSYPLTIEEIRAMYSAVDSLRDKLILLMGKDLDLRLQDFLNIKKDDVPDLKEEPRYLFKE